MEVDQQLRIEISPDEIDRLVRRLEMSRFLEAGLVVTRAELWGERIRLSMSWPGVGDEVVVIRRADSEPAFASTARLSFSVAGTSVSRPWRILIGRMALAAGDIDIDDLMAPVVAAGRSSRPYVADSPIQVWSVESAWGKFFCDHAMARKFYEAMQFEGCATFLVHGDLECKFITPRFQATLPRFFNYPWKMFGESESWDPISDLDDSDVIFGGEERLAKSIETVIEAGGVSGPLIINSTCVPVVIGDDVDKVMERFRDRCEGGLFHLSPRTLDATELMMQFLDSARERAVAEARIEPGSIELVGYRSGRTHHELLELVRRCGITVRGSILPKLSAPLMEQAMGAEVLVFRPSVHLSAMYDRVFRSCGTKRISPAAPYGFAGTSAWLEAVAESVGRGAAAAETVRLATDRYQAELDALKEAAAGHEITFVAGVGDLPRLVDPESATGLAVLPVVAELGYRVRVLGDNSAPAAFRDFSDRLRAWCANAGLEVAVDSFATPAELEQALGGVRGGAVFSEFFYDYRISRAGRAQLSARDFEMGFDGAMRTARRLARLVRTPWYGRYAGLAQDSSGSRSWWKT